MAQWAINRDVSDHCPIVLRSGSQNWGPKPFRFNNCWLEHYGFKNMIENVRKELRVEGWKAYVLNEKLKLSKLYLKKWNREVFGNVDFKLKNLEGEISMLTSKLREQVS